VTGDTKGLDATLLGKLGQLGEQLGTKVDIKSGFRSRGEQEVLYKRYLAGNGNLAAKPGTSDHEHGDAADASVHGVSLAKDARAKRIAADLGLVFPVKGEPWHVELRSNQ
jgi:D-alanyl-D-alanine carboxypeptidase